MKYRILFTLRMMARIGLSLVLTGCVVSQQFLGSMELSHGTCRISVGVFPGGWFLTHEESPFTASGKISFEATSVEDLESFFVALASWNGPDSIEEAWSQGAPIAPGIIWHPDMSAPSPRRTLKLDHWLLCLTFLMLIVLTSWRWKTAQAAMEGEDG